MNLVTSPALMENRFQLMIARSRFWLIVTLDVPSPAMVALASPPTTTPPKGLAIAWPTIEKTVSQQTQRVAILLIIGMDKKTTRNQFLVFPQDEFKKQLAISLTPNSSWVIMCTGYYNCFSSFASNRPSATILQLTLVFPTACRTV